MDTNEGKLVVDTEIEVNGYDIDAMGIVSNIVFIRWFEDLRTIFINQYMNYSEMISKGISPILMKILSIVGTAAMFLVGGGIINHALPFLHHFTEDATEVTSHLPAVGSIFGALTPTLINFVIGAIAGIIVVLVVTLGKKLFSKKA